MKANRKYLGNGNAILDERILAELLRGAIGAVNDLSSTLASLTEVRVGACPVKKAGAKPSPRF